MIDFRSLGLSKSAADGWQLRPHKRFKPPLMDVGLRVTCQYRQGSTGLELTFRSIGLYYADARVSAYPGASGGADVLMWMSTKVGCCLATCGSGRVMWPPLAVQHSGGASFIQQLFLLKIFFFFKEKNKHFLFLSWGQQIPFFVFLYKSAANHLIFKQLQHNTAVAHLKWWIK